MAKKESKDKKDEKTTRTIDEQKGRIMEEQHFDLKSFKSSDDGIKMRYFNLLFPNSEEEPNVKITPHPDLQSKMDKLKPYFADKIGILEGWNFAREHLRDNLELLDLAKKKHDEAVSGCKITGLSYTGEGDTFGISITGYHKFPKKGGSGISSGKISLSDKALEKKTLGYEDEVLEICKEIKHELYAFRFLGKKKQMDIESDPDLFDGDNGKGSSEDLK